MKLTIKTSSGATKIIETSAIHFLSTGQRWKQGAKWGGLCFLMAVGCIFIPVFHFVLVPLCLLLMIFFFFQGRKYPWRIEQLKLSCPECQTEMNINQSFKEMPFRLFCNNCHQHISATAEA